MSAAGADRGRAGVVHRVALPRHGYGRRLPLRGSKPGLGGALGERLAHPLRYSRPMVEATPIANRKVERPESAAPTPAPFTRPHCRNATTNAVGSLRSQSTRKPKNTPCPCFQPDDPASAAKRVNTGEAAATPHSHHCHVADGSGSRTATSSKATTDRPVRRRTCQSEGARPIPPL